MLLNVLLISVAVHVLALVVFGGMIAVKYIIPDDAEFEEPPAIEKVEPPKEVRVEITPPAPTPQKQLASLRMRPMANIAISSVNVDLPSMDQSFTVSTGIGGFGEGNLMGGARGTIGMGLSNVNVFGLKSKGEKILFVIDANRSMLFDEKGGINSYKVIKDEIADLVGNLSAGTLFNVMLVDREHYKLFKPRLVSTGASTTIELVKWLAPVNSSINSAGLRAAEGHEMTMTVKTELEGLEQLSQGLNKGINFSMSTLALDQMVLEMQVDAIFQILGNHKGYSRIRKNLTSTQWSAWKQEVLKVENQIKDNPKLQEGITARNNDRARLKIAVKDELAKQNEQRASKGLPPRVVSDDLESAMKTLNLRFSTPEPMRTPNPPYSWAETSEVENYFKSLKKKLFTDAGTPVTSMNIILFLAENENFSEEKEDSVDDFVRDFNGKMKIIRGLAEIKSQSAAANK